ncbi:predicted protein [Postia placenta Mad-698-R]|nr:predicted protein [Postia placenta Mad-698-R]
MCQLIQTNCKFGAGSTGFNDFIPSDRQSNPPIQICSEDLLVSTRTPPNQTQVSALRVHHTPRAGRERGLAGRAGRSPHTADLAVRGVPSMIMEGTCSDNRTQPFAHLDDSQLYGSPPAFPYPSPPTPPNLLLSQLSYPRPAYEQSCQEWDQGAPGCCLIYMRENPPGTGNGPLVPSWNDVMVQKESGFYLEKISGHIWRLYTWASTNTKPCDAWDSLACAAVVLTNLWTIYTMIYHVERTGCRVEPPRNGGLHITIRLSLVSSGLPAGAQTKTNAGYEESVPNAGITGIAGGFFNNNHHSYYIEAVDVHTTGNDNHVTTAVRPATKKPRSSSSSALARTKTRSKTMSKRSERLPMQATNDVEQATQQSSLRMSVFALTFDVHLSEAVVKTMRVSLNNALPASNTSLDMRSRAIASKINAGFMEGASQRIAPVSTGYKKTEKHRRLNEIDGRS